MTLDSSEEKKAEITKENALKNFSVEDIVKKSYDEEIITSDIVPFNNVRNNSKVFLIYYAKSQLARVIKLTNYLQLLEDRVMGTIEASVMVDPDLLLRVITSIQTSVNSALALIDKISTNDNYVNLIYNDNSQQLLDNSTNLISSEVSLTKESRDKLRRIAQKLITSLDNSGEKNV